MPPVTVYSESQFGAYLVATLDKLADTLDWDASDPRVLEAVNTALLRYGESDITAITGSANILKLRALGKWAIWDAVADATAGYYSFSSDGQRFDRHKVNEQAVEKREEAAVVCRALGADPAYAVTVLSISRPQDPYIVLSDAERAI